MMVTMLVAGCAIDLAGQHGDAMAVPPSRDVQFGADAFRKFLRAPDVILSQDLGTRERVLRVFLRVVEAAKQSSFGDVARHLPWEHVIIQNNQKVTGLAFPGGKIVLYTGLIAAAESDDQLAAAIGHLIAKVLKRHQGSDTAGGGKTDSNSSESEPSTAKTSQSPEEEKAWRRAQREEADSIGMLLSADAGFDPRGAIGLYRKLEGPDSPRAKKLEGRLAEAMSHFDAQRSRDAAPPSTPPPN
jgi:predicted Zn-dependent protease